MATTTARKGLIALAAACAIALCIGLVGCSGADKSDNKANFVGTWNAVSVSSPEIGTLTADDLKSFGLTVSLELKDDGTGQFDIMGDKMDVTWSADSATQITVKDSEGASSKLTLDGDTLSGDEDGAVMEFKRA